MCNLWVTEPSRSVRPSYFVLSDFDFSLDSLHMSMVDMGYECPISFDSADTGVVQVRKGDQVVLLHVPTIEGERYVAGVYTPYLKALFQLKRHMGKLKVLAASSIAYMGILIGVTLAGLGVRGEERPYLLDLLVQNWPLIVLFGVIIFIPLIFMASRLLRLNIPGRNYETAQQTYADLEEVLRSLCPVLKKEVIKAHPSVSYPWRESSQSIPDSVGQALDKLVERFGVFVEAGGTIWDLDIEPIEQDTYRSYPV
ncbi:hypothetical protein EU538_06020 [Candidatus Thorarchaeota archaeon]|nr:MAG: hypothetical protein EU538_06020 [Candidatus Thorarchaeota archaeon]